MSKVSIDQDQFGSVKKLKTILMIFIFSWKIIISCRYTLSTGDGFQVTVIEYGATIQSIRQPDRNHEIKEITLGYDSLQGSWRVRFFSNVEMCFVFPSRIYRW